MARISDPYQLHGDNQPLPVGTFVAAEIQGTEAKNVIRVPRRIVRGSNELMFVGADNKLQFRTINILRSDANYIYINGGAEAGELIVTTVLESPVNGMPVRTSQPGN